MYLGDARRIKHRAHRPRSPDRQGKSEMRSTLTFNSKSPDQGRAFRRGP
jgi:hypothetical protein